MRSVYEPAGEPAGRYAGEGPPVPSTPVVDALVAAVGEIAAAEGRPAPVSDGRLFAVAGEVASLLAGGPPPYEAVEFALSHHGIVEPAPHLHVLPLRDDDVGAVIEELRPRLGRSLRDVAASRLGIGVADAVPGVRTIVVALQESGVEIEPFPRELPAGAKERLRGRVLAPFRKPSVHLTRQDGAVIEAPTVRDGASFRAEIDCGAAPGKLKVEVVADDAAGSPSVLANFAVYCGVAAPRVVALGAPEPAPTDAAEVERVLLELANRDRRAAGLPPLEADERAAAVARAHSVEMRDGGYVSHVSPRTGRPVDRARRARLATPLVLENLARSRSARQAHQGLMDSPGHRANLLSPQATHVGIGVALGELAGSSREILVTQLFIRKGPRVDAAEARREAAKAFAAARASAGLPAVSEDERLRRVAQAYATGLAAGQPDAMLAARADAELDTLAGHFSQIVTLIGVSMDARDSVREAARDRRVASFGLGVAQGSHAELGEGVFHVVVLLARPRAGRDAEAAPAPWASPR
jgi:uncharacterized protein YkwD